MKYENLNINLITGNRKFWENIKSSFSDKSISSSNIILYDNEVLISNENKLDETFNSYFSNIALKLDIKDVGNYNLDNGDISNPILMAINKYADHPSIVVVNNNCVSSIKHSYSILSQQDILKVVQDFDVSKATAIHNIPTRIFKENMDIDRITNIFNLGTIECNFPSNFLS